MKKFTEMIDKERKVCIYCHKDLPIGKFTLVKGTTNRIKRCIDCYNSFYRKEMKHRRDIKRLYTKAELDSLIEFIERIESRDGRADIREVFIELITFYNMYGRRRIPKNLSPSDQLTFMWESIKDFR